MDRGAQWATVHGVAKELNTTNRLKNSKQYLNVRSKSPMMDKNFIFKMKLVKTNRKQEKMEFIGTVLTTYGV